MASKALPLGQPSRISPPGVVHSRRKPRREWGGGGCAWHPPKRLFLLTMLHVPPHHERYRSHMLDPSVSLTTGSLGTHTPGIVSPALSPLGDVQLGCLSK
jgi:hypothetical protein